MRCCNRKEQQIFKLDGRQKREASREKLLEMPAPSSVYVSGLSPSQHRGLPRQNANGQHDAGTGRLHCDLCSVFCMRARRSVTILAQCQAIGSGFFLCWLEGRWDGGSSAVSCSQTPPLQQVQPVRNGRTKPARQHVQPANEAAGTEGILPAASGDWPLIGVKNRFYAPMPFSLCHSPILRSPASTTTTPTTTARRPRAARRDEQTLSPPAISELSQVLTREANGIVKTASRCSMDPFRG